MTRSSGPLASGARTHQQLENHYLVERAIAQRLKSASREERSVIYRTMYDELFAKVPDHPRLTRRSSEAQTRIANAEKMSLVRHLIGPSTVLLEFAPGDCHFAMLLAKHVRQVYAVDISDQRGISPAVAANFKYIIYDGYHLEDVPLETVDVIFSDQLIEHFHPEDLELHLSLSLRLLRAGGSYVFRTPHAHSGPHDVSQHFSTEPEGFHLKEWCMHELCSVLTAVGFKRVTPLWRIGDTVVPVPQAAFKAYESLISALRGRSRTLTRRLLPSICLVAEK